MNNVSPIWFTKTKLDEDYPDLLRAVSAPPPVLYYRGDAGIPNRCFTFAIVGTRRPSAYGVEATASIAGELARAGVALVSGLATGLDSESHKAAVQAGAPTVACIAFGHDQCYPAANRTLKGVIERQGLVLSEYPPGTPPQRGYFLQRNRLIAGLSRGRCVAEARRRSGTMNTVAAALAAGRDVFSVPGSIFSPLCEGTNQLLREGAVPAVSGADILLWYGLARPEQPEKAKPDGAPLSLDAQRMRDALSAAALRIQAVNAQREFFRDQDTVRVHGFISKGGEAMNVIWIGTLQFHLTRHLIDRRILQICFLYSSQYVLSYKQRSFESMLCPPAYQCFIISCRMPYFPINLRDCIVHPSVI